MKLVGFDIETTGLRHDEDGAEILTAVAYTPGTTISGVMGADFYHLFNGAKDLHGARLAGQNILAFDNPWWIQHVAEWPWSTEFFDTQIAQSLLDEECDDNSLLGNARRYVGDDPDIEFMEKMKGQRKSLAGLDLEEVVRYNKVDARVSYLVAEAQWMLLEEYELAQLFLSLMDIGKTLSRMMARGVLVDKQWADQRLLESKLAADEHEEAVRYMTEMPDLNVNSPKQLAELLFEELGMPYVRKTKSGKPSTSSAALKELQSKSDDDDIDDFLGHILSYREHKKLIGTYYEPMRNKLTGKDGRVRTTYHMGHSKFGGTVTGRLSSSKPNLQNIPRSKSVKGMFIPSYGYTMYDADYSQIELRVAAWYAEEPSMMKAFAEGRDIHTATLSDMEGVSYEEAVERVESGEWSEKRSNVKRVNFLILYGGGANTLVELSRDVGAEMNHRQAAKLMDSWYRARPELSQWIKETHLEAQIHGQLTTPFGRVRRLPEAAALGPEAARQLRQGVNFMVQSMASDIMLLALREVDMIDDHLGRRYGPAFHLYHRPLMTVHDSVIGEFHRNIDEDEQIEQLQEAMVARVNDRLLVEYNITGLPLAVDITTGMIRWGEPV